MKPEYHLTWNMLGKLSKKAIIRYVIYVSLFLPTRVLSSTRKHNFSSPALTYGLNGCMSRINRHL